MTPPKRIFVVTLHDVAPPTEQACVRWTALLDEWQVPRRTLAVVPFFDNRHRLSDSASLVEFLRAEVARGSEIVLHGCTHRFEGAYDRLGDRLYDRWLTRGCAEFSRLDEPAARERLLRGKKELEDALGIAVRGFIAPGWWQSQSVVKILREAGFRFCESVGGVMDLRDGKLLRSPVLTGLPAPWPPCRVFLRAYAFLWLPFYLRNRLLFRVALHPYDLEDPRFLHSAKRLLARLRRLRVPAACEEAMG